MRRWVRLTARDSGGARHLELSISEATLAVTSVAADFETVSNPDITSKNTWDSIKRGPSVTGEIHMHDQIVGFNSKVRGENLARPLVSQTRKKNY